MDEDSCARDLENMPSDEEDEGVGGGRKVDGDDVKVMEWVEGLPSRDDLVPLSQPLVSPELASAFSIPPPELKTLLDIHRATQHTASNLRRHQNLSKSSSQKPTLCADNGAGSSSMATTGEIEGDSASLPAAENSAEDNSNRMLKRPRLVWTPQLHKRFVDVVAHLGIKNAVPKTIMQLMNVDGLSRENVASHLQKYRLYLKRMQGLSNEGPSPSDHLFASTPVPRLIPMQVYGIPHHHANGVVPLINNLQGGQLYNGFDSVQRYELPNDLSGGTKFASIVYNPYASPNDNLRTGEKQQQ